MQQRIRQRRRTPLAKSNFIQTQHEFTQYIRNPDTAPAPKGIEKRRADIYRELFYNNIEGFLADNFPVLKKVMSDENWHKMINGFFAQHSSSSPYFSDIPEEFIAYLQAGNCTAQQDEYPFLIELAHYEWAELVVTIADDTPQTETMTDAENQALTLSNTAWPLAYQYPVHQISPTAIPSTVPENPSYIVVYRNTDDDVVFLETNPSTHGLLELMSNNTQQTTVNLLTKLAADMKHPNPSVIIEGGLSILKDFIHRGIIVPA